MSAVKLNAVCYRGEEIRTYWESAALLLQPAIDLTRGQFTRTLLRDALRARRLQLWLDPEHPSVMAAVTAITQYPGLRVLSILLVGGKGIRSWHADLIATLTEFGRANACSALEACVRSGLIGAVYRKEKAILKGWDTMCTQIRKPI